MLWDKESNTIVNNESSEIIRMLNSEFQDIARRPEVELFPEPLREKIDEPFTFKLIQTIRGTGYAIKG